ncbi:ATP-dependent helicase [Janibacter sp. G1551]|uniref:ATP-dependent helicase n=1 Tax=Janibacter sp. G1551 TaxID=3420440 RepID=UPI003CFBC577
MLTLHRPTTATLPRPELDAAQRAAVEHRGPLLRVLGAPGTGTTTVAVEAVASRVRSGELRAEECVLLTSSRVAAARLRDAVTAAVAADAPTAATTEPLARTAASFGFGILRAEAALRGEPVPRLLTGPEQDVILRDLLAGHAAGLGAAGEGPLWPQALTEALTTRGFRGELRDLLMRAVELGLEPGDLAALGRSEGREEWVAAAKVLAEYDEVTALSTPGGYDPAWVLTAAADLLEDDEEALDRLRSSIRLVVVDDAQDLSRAGARLVRTLTAGGAVDLILTGDPDAAVQTFRGGDPRLLMTWGEERGQVLTDIVLTTSHRLPSAILSTAARVTARIGALGGAPQRAVEAARTGGEVEAHLLRSVSQEATWIASRLRRAHLLDGVPWSEMAVVVRGRGRTATLRRVLAAAGVPLATPSSDLAVRDESAVRPLLTLLDAVLRLARLDEDGGAGEAAVPLSAEAAVDVLTSPLGGADAVTLRRLRRALRRRELDSGGGRSSDELLPEALLDPAGLAVLGADGAPELVPARRIAAVIAAGVEAARWDAERGRWAPGVTAETVLWAMWDASRLASAWRATALAGGTAGARADRDLDAVVALFDAASRYVDRLPLQGPHAFLEHVASQDVAADTLSARSPDGEAVALLTPPSAAGRQWHLVVVAGVQEGVWPDLRLRGSLLGSERLVDLVTGRGDTLRAAQAAVRYDETRLFHVAMTRASHHLIVTAVRTEDEQPSPYLDLVLPRPDDGVPRPFTEVGRTFTLPSLAAHLRRDLLDDDHDVARAAAERLARLAGAGVRGAHPESWWAVRGLTDDRPRRADDEEVRVSPSRVQAFQDCGLRWVLTTSGGDGPSIGAASVGTLVHDIAETLGDVDTDTFTAEIDRRWGELGMPSGWVSDRKRREAHAMAKRLTTYIREAGEQGWQKVGAEVDMRVPLGRALLAGRVDRIEQDAQGRVRVIDYKTGSGKPSAADLPEHPQLGCYQVAITAGGFADLGDLGRESGGAALLQLGKAANKSTTLQRQAPLAEAEDPAWAERLVVETADGMAAATFTATRGDGCRVCPVRACCPVQPEGGMLW